MSLTIWKYGLMITDEQELTVPPGFRPLSVAVQRFDHGGMGVHEELCLWAEVEPDGTEEHVTVCLRGTGHPFVGNEGLFVGTAMMRGGSLVWHVYMHHSFVPPPERPFNAVPSR